MEKGTRAATKGDAANADCTILVTSCDAYRDVEGPFLACWRRFWPDCPFETVLVTETLPTPGFDRAVLTGAGKTWCEMLAEALDAIHTPYVLLLMNDYLLCDNVDTASFVARLDEAKRHGAANLRLVPNPPGRKPFGDTNLLEMPKNVAYCVTCQTGIWNREFLLGLARRNCSAWEFERYGSFMVGDEPRPLLVTRDREFPFVDAVHKGYWEREGVELVKRLNIAVDFSRRGLPPWRVRMAEAAKTLVFALFPWSFIVRLQNIFNAGAKERKPSRPSNPAPEKRKRLVIVAASVSMPGNMGGNTKISLEMARNLPKLGWEVAVVVPKAKKATFLENIGEISGCTYWTIDDFPGSELRKPLRAVWFYAKRFNEAFKALGVSASDIVYANCNFHFEIAPLTWLKRRFHYKYLPSHYLFSPFIVENLIRRYRFPPVKYLAVWLYERFFFLVAKAFADGFVITNDSDRCHFSKKFQDRVIAIYGGVNVEQIPSAECAKMRDAVFCSRLHPQKGVEGLLEIWSLVAKECRDAKLSLIGNGEAGYERALRSKAAKLGIDGNVEWMGYVNNEAKYRIYAESRVFLHSTVFDNNGMVAAEALCSGLPVVMYNLAPLRRVYTRGCVKVPYGDKKAFAAQIVRLLTDAEYMAGAAPSKADVEELRAYWNWPNRAEMMVEYLERLYG